ncbi:hypothetical protein GGX14DRAFT_574753 [Mycena pura]|uniref:Uncharacterized protein n=1 Tax=Mycena pura TaxID=153505 RepID=A0AAD6V3S3_9AGAR|nr:hypothetical protein GGX14DRAFT_574753 [Mycena pura]
MEARRPVGVRSCTTRSSAARSPVPVHITVTGCTVISKGEPALPATRARSTTHSTLHVHARAQLTARAAKTLRLRLIRTPVPRLQHARASRKSRRSLPTVRARNVQIHDRRPPPAVHRLCKHSAARTPRLPPALPTLRAPAPAPAAPLAAPPFPARASRMLHAGPGHARSCRPLPAAPPYPLLNRSPLRWLPLQYERAARAIAQEPGTHRPLLVARYPHPAACIRCPHSPPASCCSRLPGAHARCPRPSPASATTRINRPPPAARRRNISQRTLPARCTRPAPGPATPPAVSLHSAHRAAFHLHSAPPSTARPPNACSSEATNDDVGRMKARARALRARPNHTRLPLAARRPLSAARFPPLAGRFRLLASRFPYSRPPPTPHASRCPLPGHRFPPPTPHAARAPHKIRRPRRFSLNPRCIHRFLLARRFRHVCLAIHRPLPDACRSPLAARFVYTSHTATLQSARRTTLHAARVAQDPPRPDDPNPIADARCPPHAGTCTRARHASPAALHPCPPLALTDAFARAFRRKLTRSPHAPAVRCPPPAGGPVAHGPQLAVRAPRPVTRSCCPPLTARSSPASRKAPARRTRSLPAARRSLSAARHPQLASWLSPPTARCPQYGPESSNTQPRACPLTSSRISAARRPPPTACANLKQCRRARRIMPLEP